MAGSRRGQAIPTQLDSEVFEQFVLPHLSTGSRGPAPKLSLFKIFNYILQLLYLGCQWKALVSGQKPNRFNWLESIEVSLLGWSDDNAVCNGIFSKIVTERTCINV